MTDSADGRGRGLVLILAATATAGAFGYLIQLLAPALLVDAQAYLAFSVFWSTLYLFVSSVGGVQQEVTRATHPATPAPRSTVLRSFTLLAAGALVVVAIVMGFALSPVAFSAAPVAMTLAFAIGLVGYLLTAVLAGVLYGLGQWGAIALLTIIDATLRGLAVGVGLLVGAPAGVLSFLIALPFGLAFGVVWLGSRERVVGRFRLDVGPRRLAINALGTVTAAAAMGVLVTGMPLLLRSLVPGFTADALAGLILVVTLTRAPLIVPLMALQSFLIVDFRTTGADVWARLVRYAAAVAGATALLTVAAWVWGPWIVEAISGGKYSADATTVAAVMVSAGLVALMCLTGPALLSEGRHAWYVAGWVVAALVTVGALLVPADPLTSSALALLAGPLAGVVAHAAGIRARGGRSTSVG